MGSLSKINPIMIPWKAGQTYLVTGEDRTLCAKMLAASGRQHRVDLKFNILPSAAVAKVASNPDAVTLLIASATIDPQKFCTEHREITHVIQAHSLRSIAIANLKTGRIKNYALVWGNSDEVAFQSQFYK